uniref:tRNA-yW synthesizing protein 5 n=1 Tax=Salmo trutta TaxID=8032 RepID=A0A673Y6G6_SALTR
SPLSPLQSPTVGGDNPQPESMVPLRPGFVPITLPFDEFIKRAAEKKHSDFFLCEESYYLRSLVEEIRKEPSDLRKHFPDLAEDFHIPEFFEPAQFFSSVFRISLCGLQLWTHYNVSEGLCERRDLSPRTIPPGLTSVQYPHSPSALWFHNTLVYKDPYGNKNPVAPAWAFQALERALHILK